LFKAEKKKVFIIKPYQPDLSLHLQGQVLQYSVTTFPSFLHWGICKWPI